MNDEDIMNIVYDHADCFSSGIMFSDQGIIDFANAIINANHLTAPKEKPFYKDSWTENFMKNLNDELSTSSQA